MKTVLSASQKGIDMKYIGNNNTSSLFTLVYSELRNDILAGLLKPGESLTEVKISNELGVSRTPVREAIRQLEHDGLVRSVPNKGAVVVGISKADIEDMYTIRIFTESLAAEWATVHITQEELDQLGEIVELQEFFSKKNDFAQVWQYDAKFHNVIYTACKSRMLQHVLVDFHSYASRARELSIHSPARLLASVEEHRKIYEAIKARDGFAARKSAEEHLFNARKSVIESLHITENDQNIK